MEHRVVRRRILLAGVIAGLVCAAASLAAGGTDPGLDDPQLQVRISVDAARRPLGDVLKGISADAGIELRAGAPIGDQRVTLQVAGQAVHTVMDRLAGLLGHSSADDTGYRWRRSTLRSGRPAFILIRDARSIAEERALLEYPRRKVQEWLRDFRDLAKLPAEQRAQFSTDLNPSLWRRAEWQPLMTAFADLSDADLAALAAGRLVPVDPAEFREFEPRYTERVRQARERAAMIRSQELAEGRPDPYPQDLPDPPPFAPSLRLRWEDAEGDQPWRTGDYSLSLNQVLDYEAVLRPSDARADRSVFHQDGPVVDLGPYLDAPGVTPEQRGDVGFTVRALAKAAKVNAYEEHFYTPHLLGTWSRGIRRLKGPLPALLEEICLEWGYTVHKVGNDYLFWPGDWPFARRRDIPERLITPWRDRLIRQGALTLDDRGEMARTFTQAQLRGTMRFALPESGQWLSGTTRLLRFYGHLSAGERGRAVSPRGLPASSLARGTLDLLARDLLRDVRELTPEELLHSRITFGTPESVGSRLRALRVESPRRVLYEAPLPVEEGSQNRPAPSAAR